MQGASFCLSFSDYATARRRPAAHGHHGRPQPQPCGSGGRYSGEEGEEEGEGGAKKAINAHRRSVKRRRQQKKEEKKNNKKKEVFYYTFICFPASSPFLLRLLPKKEEPLDLEKILMNFISMFSGFLFHLFF